LSDSYLIDGIDFDNIEKGDTIRLMHFANFEIIEKTKDKLKLKFLSKDYNRALKVKRNIHFIPTNKEEQRKVTIVMQDNSKINGLSEVLYNPKVDASLQFERFGFVRLDEIKEDGTRVFWFTHR